MWEHGNDLILGKDANGEDIRMSPDQRSMHLWIPGLTGSGKTSFIEGLIRQDIEQWVRTECGICVIDPDGALYRHLVAWMTEREEWMRRPLWPIDLTQDEWVIAFDVLRARGTMPQATIAQNVTAALANCLGQGDLAQTPLFARIMESVAVALIAANRPITEAVAILKNKSQCEKLIREVRGRISDIHLATLQELLEKGKHDETGSTYNRLFRLLRNESIRRMVSAKPHHGQSLDFGRAMEEGAIVLINLNTAGGFIQSDDAKVLASLILSDLWTATCMRGENPRNKPFYLYIDELGQFASSPVLPDMLQRGRKFGLHLTLANQYPSQLRIPGEVSGAFLNAVKAGCRSKVIFHLSDPADLEVTAEMLFRDRMDVDEVKHVLESTKVLDYDEQTRVSYSMGMTETHSSASGYGLSESETDSVTEGESENLALSQGAFPNESGAFGLFPKERIRHDNIGELDEEQYELTAQVNSSKGRSDSASRSRGKAKSSSEVESSATGSTYTETMTSVMVPILGKEVSSVTFRSLEEQRHRAMSSIQALRNRTAWVRLIDSEEPRLLRTTTIKQARLGTEDVAEWMTTGFVADTLKKLPFAVRKADMHVEPAAHREQPSEPEDFFVPETARDKVVKPHVEAEAAPEKPKARRKSQPPGS